MKRLLALICVWALTALAVDAAAADLELGPGEMRNLGVEFSRPGAVNALAALNARAYVIIPPSSEYVISSTLQGLVARIRAEAGDRVSAGQALVEIRSSDFLTLQQEYLEALHLAGLATAQLARDVQLADEGIIAERRLEETRARAAAADGRRSEHRQLLLISGLREQDLKGLEDSGQLADTLVIRAPIDGVILARSTKAGESVDSLVPLYRLADLTELWLDIRVPQESVGGIDVGMIVLIRESAMQQRAQVVSVGQSVDPNTQTVSVRARLMTAGHGLKPGQLVSASISSDESVASNATLWSIPTAALVRSGDRVFVFTRSMNGVDAREVVPAGRTSDEVQVNGLDGDEEVVVSGVSALKALWLGERDTGS